MTTADQVPVTAVIAVRNGARYVSTLLPHLIANGVRCIFIDHDSEDDLHAELRPFRAHIDGIHRLPWRGCYDQLEQLAAKERCIESVTEGWVIHHDIDELLTSDRNQEPLNRALARVQAEGFDVVDFDEFVFLPLAQAEQAGKLPFGMDHYYYFQPSVPRLLRAFRPRADRRFEGGGHLLTGPLALFPERFVLRHYMFRDLAHLREKYRSRTYADGDLARGFHFNRVPLQGKTLEPPPVEELHQLVQPETTLNTTRPRRRHFWEW